MFLNPKSKTSEILIFRNFQQFLIINERLLLDLRLFEKA